MMREKLDGLFAGSIAASHQVLSLPSVNPQTGLLLRVVGQPDSGFLLQLFDPNWSLVWERYLDAEQDIENLR